MHVVSDVEERRRIAELAQEALDRHRPSKYRILVDGDAILQEDEWYHIVVRTEKDVRDREFYEALAEAEAELQDENGHQYLLVPAVGE